MEKAAPHDLRIAFLSIDNAFDTVLSTYLEVVAPESSEPSPKLPDRLPRNFPARLALVETLNGDLFSSAELLDIEYYHRMRNQLYHQGLGGGIDVDSVRFYFDSAKRAFESLLSTSFVPQTDKLANLTPEARAAIVAEIKQRQSRKHGEKTKAGADKATREGRKGVPGRPTNGVQAEEVPLMIELHQKGYSYNRIAQALSQRRRRRGLSGPAAEVAWQKVRRKLVSLGFVTSESFPRRARKPT